MLRSAESHERTLNRYVFAIVSSSLETPERTRTPLRPRRPGVCRLLAAARHGGRGISAGGGGEGEGLDSTRPSTIPRSL